VNVDGVDPKTFTVGRYEITTWKLAGERRHIVRIRHVRTGEAVWRQQLRQVVWQRIQERLQELQSEDDRA
jgi:hypothetical protein